MPISILLPFLSNLFPHTPININYTYLIENIPYNEIPLLKSEKNILSNTLNYSTLLTWCYFFVSIFYICRLILSNLKLIYLRQTAIVRFKENHQLVFTKVPEIFSYFHWIFIPLEKQNNYNTIVIEHEKAHVKMKHSIDLIIVELYKALFWINPILYFYKKSIKSVHEFQADDDVLTKNIKKSYYLELLVQNLKSKQQNNLYSYFNQPVIKKRVNMILKNKSNLLFKLTYLSIVPICLFFLVAFSPSGFNQVPTSNNIKHSNNIPSLFPLHNKTQKDITSHFGVQRRLSKTSKLHIHSGIDIRATSGTPIFATADGIILQAKTQGNWGNLIIIAHTNGYQTRYAHLNGFNVQKNQQVQKGKIIGYTGNTGLSKGPHLHYEILQNGQHVNPINYLK